MRARSHQLSGRRHGAGASNTEVAAQIFLGPHTVEYHPGKVFITLGAGSRADPAAPGILGVGPG